MRLVGAAVMTMRLQLREPGSPGVCRFSGAGGPWAVLEIGCRILSVGFFLEPLETLFWSSMVRSRRPEMRFSYL